MSDKLISLDGYKVKADKSLADLFIFAKEVLGYNLLSNVHLSWYETLLKSKFLLLLAPRSHLKSTAITVAYVLWRLVQDPNMRILILNEIHANAQNFLREIKQHLTQNQRFRERYGNWDSAASRWTENSIIIPRTRITKEPSISICGVLGTVLSMHSDLIVLDDPISDKNSFTGQQRSKVATWFRNVVLPMLEPNGQMIMVGTRWHYQDLYSEILTDPGFDHWNKIVQKAEWKDEFGHRHLLFPERFTPQMLDELKASMGTASYGSQMLNDPSGQEGADFKLEWLRAAYYDRAPEKMSIYMGVDLAMTKKEEGSRFAIVVVGVLSSGDTYILEAYRDRLNFSGQIQAIKRYVRIFKPMLTAIENNAYQESLLQMLRVDEETKRLPIKGITTTGEKLRRIKSMAPLFEGGKIRLPRGLQEFEEEFAHFPRGNDDLLDALYLALQAVNEMRVEARIYYVDDLA